MNYSKNPDIFIKDFYTRINSLASGLEQNLSEYDHLCKEFYRKLDKFKHLRTPYWDNWAADACRQYVIHRAFRTKALPEEVILKSGIKDLSFRLYSPIQSAKPVTEDPAMIPDLHLLENSLNKKQEMVVVPGLEELFNKFNASLVLILTAELSDDAAPVFAVGPIITFNNASAREIIKFAVEAEKRVISKKSSKGSKNKNSKAKAISTIKDLHIFINKNPVPFLVLIWVSMHPENLKYTPQAWIKNIVKGFFG